MIRQIALLLVLFPFAMATVADAQLHNVLSDFEPSGDYQLKVDGAVVPAEISLSRKAAALMVRSASLPAPVVIFARSKRVDSVPSAAVIEQGSKLSLTANAERTYLGDFSQDGLELVIPGDVNARLAPKPPLTGTRAKADLLQHSPGYRQGMNAYRIDDLAVDRLAKTAGAEIKVVFGSWCGHCKQMLPHILRLEEELAARSATSLTFDYYGIDNPPAGWQDPEVGRLNVKGLPTAIVYRNGEEIGRFTGHDGFEKVEATLVEMLKSP